MSVQETIATKVKCLSSSNSYKTLMFLGEGASCTCYMVTDFKDRRQLACKIISHTSFGSSDARREHEILCRMNHANVLKSFDFYADEVNTYIYTELCERGTLKTFVKKTFPLPSVASRRLLFQAFEAVDYLQSMGIIHRDIKPDNYFLTEDLTVKLGDFGFAIEASNIDEERCKVVGTPGYISPEIAGLKRYGLEADIWSYGCVVYFVLTKRYFVSPICATKDMYTIPSDVDEKGLDLMKKLFRTKPRDRLTPKEIECHPYFSGLKKQDIDTNRHVVDVCNLDSKKEKKSEDIELIHDFRSKCMATDDLCKSEKRLSVEVLLVDTSSECESFALIDENLASVLDEKIDKMRLDPRTNQPLSCSRDIEVRFSRSVPTDCVYIPSRGTGLITAKQTYDYSDSLDSVSESSFSDFEFPLR